MKVVATHIDIALHVVSYGREQFAEFIWNRFVSVTRHFIARQGSRLFVVASGFLGFSERFEVKIVRYSPTISTTSRAASRNLSVFILSSIISGNCTLPSGPVTAQASSRTVESDDMSYFE